MQVTAGCDNFTAMGSILVGIGAAAVYYQANRFIEWMRIDDVVSAGPVHGAAGAFGIIAVGMPRSRLSLPLPPLPSACAPTPSPASSLPSFHLPPPSPSPLHFPPPPPPPSLHSRSTPPSP